MSESSSSTSWPPKYPQQPTIDPGPSITGDISEVENRVKKPSVATQGTGPAALRGPGVRGTRYIPHRSSHSRVPSVRTPPPGLWQVSNTKSANVEPLSTSLSDGILDSSPTPCLSCTTRKPSLMTESPRLIPIGSERQRRLLVDEGPQDIAVPRKPLQTLVSSLDEHTNIKKPLSWNPLTVASILAMIKRRNPHAPSMVSMFNPIRDNIPARTWAYSYVSLTSARFRTPVTPSNRSRAACDWDAREARITKTFYMNKTILHCHGCQADTLRKKILVLSYFLHQAQLLLGPPLIKVIDEDAMDVDNKDANLNSDDDLLGNRRMLRDLDDFDDFDNTDGDLLLSDDQRTNMVGLRLF